VHGTAPVHATLTGSECAPPWLGKRLMAGSAGSIEKHPEEIGSDRALVAAPAAMRIEPAGSVGETGLTSRKRLGCAAKTSHA